MKTVHTADMIAHLWANRSQDSARTSSGNFFFNGAALHSYGSHFIVAAHLDNGRILWNDSSYSNTTSRHQMLARRALRAWDAPSRLLHAPSLGSVTWEELGRIKRLGTGRELPMLAKACADEVRSLIASMTKMRRTGGPIAHAWRLAQTYEASGRALCEYVAHGKRAPKWPVPMLPAELPEGEALREMIRAVSRGALLETYEREGVNASQALALAARAGGDRYEVQNVPSYISQADRAIAYASQVYASATGHKSLKVRALTKELAAIKGPAMARYEAFRTDCARQELRGLLRDIFAHFRSRTHEGGRADRWRGRKDSGYFARKMDATLHGLPEPERTQHAQTLARIERCDRWDCAANALESARSAMETARTYLGPNFTRGDAVRHFRSALEYANGIARFAARFAQVHALEISVIQREASGMVEMIMAEVAAENATRIDRWKAGERVTIPYATGTFARIRDDLMETSRGATVPLAHACRLAGLARRVISAGGRTWPEGEGPIVGGFRVRSIEASGRTVIGCHEFEAPEALRLLALLEGCEACARVTETEGV